MNSRQRRILRRKRERFERMVLEELNNPLKFQTYIKRKYRES